MLDYLLIFATAMLTALALVPILRRWALSAGALDVPDERKVHQQAIPRLGGVAIFISFLFASLVFIETDSQVRAILAGALVVFVGGVIDDLYGLSPRKKFAFEVAGVLVTMVVGQLYLTNLGDLFGLGPIVLPLWLAVPFTVFAVVGVINAINLIDGLDGLSGGISVIALATFMLLGIHVGNAAVMALSAALLGALLGFLKFNAYPARIFMGDAGSLTVGFVLGFLAIHLTQSAQATVSPMVPVVILGVPILDTIWVMTYRILRGKSPFAPDMTHVHHKFLHLGFQHRLTVLNIYAASLFWAAFAVTCREWPAYGLLLVFLLGSLVVYLGLRHLLNHKDRYAFLAIDSALGWRESGTYRYLADQVARTMPLLRGLLLVYVAFSVYVGLYGYGTPLVVGCAVLLGAAVLFMIQCNLFSRLIQMLLYLDGLLLAFIMDRAHAASHMPWLAIPELARGVFLVMLLLVGLKVLFRRSGELHVGTAEIQVLGAGVFALVAFAHIPELKAYSTLPLQGGILYLAFKIIAFDYRPSLRNAAQGAEVAVRSSSS